MLNAARCPKCHKFSDSDCEPEFLCPFCGYKGKALLYVDKADLRFKDYDVAVSDLGLFWGGFLNGRRVQ